ncbi:PAS domain-containing sensor histidine kinase [Methylibium sp. Root1272]|uniref:sensor histidine kinase n=1 Tax=Methylibium sp. Root1272 TaxID=1736441 RepID=UPI0006FF762A|nr:ATP-binding protein [Methylibium sp. Root1272]KQW69628.1 histidine kinase [Methylibium sp. Root1272]
MAGTTGSGRRRAPADGGASWFGSIELGLPGDDDAAQSRFDRGEWRETDAADSRFLSRQARRIAGSGQSAVYRLYRAFVASRAVLGLALLATEVAITWLSPRPQRELVLSLCSLYAMVALLLWVLPNLMGPMQPALQSRLRRRHWMATIGVDMLSFGALHLLAGGGALNYSALLVLPVLMAGVLTPRLQALGVAAGCTLILLAAAGLNVDVTGEATLQLTQAGLAGVGLFVVGLMAGELSGRLAREELTARGSLELARQQAQLNRLVLEEMQDGVMVVDRRGRVRAANPAARHLLDEPLISAADSFSLTGVPAWQPLVRAVDRAFGEGHWPEGGRDVVLPRVASSDTGPRQLRLRVRFTRRRETGAPEDYCVLFLEDLRTVQARVRQEKLAAMGRVSAGIAHEIRNPLAAIMQANALLAEDASTAQQVQLTRMVGENAERLKRIVDDVMEVAPGLLPEPVPLDASLQVATICGEWARTAGLAIGADSVLRVDLPSEPLGVVFDGEHLRRVLVNLLDNALRHGSRTAGAVLLRLAVTSDSRVLLTVASDGEQIAPEVERYLFEPFFSTRSRGTGLGLYICRELCERYGASIEYGSRGAPERHRNVFSVAMRRTLLPDSDSRLHFSA